MKKPRITPLPSAEMRKDWLDTLDKLPGNGLKGKHAPVNVLGTLMKHTDLIGHYLEYWVSAKNVAELNARAQELIILRIAIHYDCDYVWGHHIPPALESGLSRGEIELIPFDINAADWSSYDQVLLKATDELILNRAIKDGTWGELSTYLSEHECLDFIHLVTQYVFFSSVNNTFQVELESGIERIPAEDNVKSIVVAGFGAN